MPVELSPEGDQLHTEVTKTPEVVDFEKGLGRSGIGFNGRAFG